MGPIWNSLRATSVAISPRPSWVLGAILALGVGCAINKNKNKEPEGESPADKHYRVAMGSFQNGMYEDSKLQLERALESDPDHADSHYLRGVLYLQQAKTIVDAVEIDRCLNDEAATRQRQRAEGLHRDAHESFEHAASHYDEGAAGRGRAYNSMSVVSLFFHDHDAAIGEAREALRNQFYTERYSALTNLGWAFYGQGDLVDAMTELRQAVLINPEYCVGRYRLSQVYLDSDMVEQALEEASTVIEEPRCPIQDAHRIAGAARLRLGHDEDAAGAFQTCVDLAPKSCLAEDCRHFLTSK